MVATMGETTDKCKWWETARPGDQFVGLDGQRCMVTAVTAKGLGYVFEDRTHGGWLDQSHLTECKPLHVENMRRHVAAVLDGGLEADDGALRFGGRFDGPSSVTHKEAAVALIPDDWQPSGGGS